MSDLSQDQWAKQYYDDEDAVLIDVRTEVEYNQGHIPNSILIDIFKGQGFVYRIDELDKSKKYFVYCRSGARSGQACNIMNRLGFENAFNLVGGIQQWKGEIIYPEN
ncbi:MAG: rhodanese-like domain-containing protein [Flavobacteriaceae bacterium]|nr:rhodanese-like domain-containing protein [Bacteroidia bacterium]NNK83769.1 rhodanese-like domain-containing protein [Flavobacteriaceae bacterium]